MKTTIYLLKKSGALLLALIVAVSCYSQSILIDSTFYTDS